MTKFLGASVSPRQPQPITTSLGDAIDLVVCFYFPRRYRSTTKTLKILKELDRV